MTQEEVNKMSTEEIKKINSEKSKKGTDKKIKKIAQRNYSNDTVKYRIIRIITQR